MVTSRRKPLSKELNVVQASPLTNRETALGKQILDRVESEDQLNKDTVFESNCTFATRCNTILESKEMEIAVVKLTIAVAYFLATFTRMGK